MGFMSKFLGKKTAEVKANLQKIENKDFMEAIVGACILIAYADGDCEESELKTMESVISANDQLKHFGGEISTTISKFHTLMQAGPRIGKMKILREIADLKADEKGKEEVFVTAITIAEADGEIEPQEQVVLKEIGQTLGLSLKDFGLAA